MSIDALFDRVHDCKAYNCVHFLCEAWQHVTGTDLRPRMRSFYCSIADMHADKATMRQLQPIKQPISPCIVLLTSVGHASHVGLYYNGKVLHLSEQGVQYMPLHIVQLTFNRTRFYQ